jgi:DNA-binding CsgD family transcriptional regulator
MARTRPDIPEAVQRKWRRVVDLTAQLAQVPASLIMRTLGADHSVLVASGGEGNPYRIGQSFVLNSKLYCHAVLQSRDELVVRDASGDPDWCDNQDLEHGMTFYVGYPLAWPDGELFGTICVLDRRDNEAALVLRDLLSEFRALVEGDLALLTEMAERARLETELADHARTLERRVAERTAQLSDLNAELEVEIAQRRRAEAALRLREQELEETNVALRVLLSRVESTRREHEESVLRQLESLVLPHVRKLKQTRGAGVEAHVEVLEASLLSITSAFSKRLVTAFGALTPTEIEIAQLIIAGRTSKEIAKLMLREPSTIDFHRNNIRKKLRVDRRDMSLRSYLVSLQ